MRQCVCGTRMACAVETEGPHVGLAVVVLALTYFRGQIVGRADARRSKFLSIRHDTAIVIDCRVPM